MSIFDIHDDLGWFFGDKTFILPSFTSRSTIKLVDLDNYTLSPRKSFIEREIKAKEATLQELKEQKTNYLHRFEEQERSLLAEIGNLKTQLAKKIEKE
jgi:hypothetical protein